MIISEYPPGTQTRLQHFLERNRIVSGLCRGVCLIEAPQRSGALATARFTLEQNRDLFVVPGPARHPNFAGSHELLRAGATLVINTAQILENYGWQTSEQSMGENAFSAEELAILGTLREAANPLDIDKITELTHLKPHCVSQTLSFLILKNRVKENESGFVITA